MANNATAISGLSACTSPAATDFIMISSNTAANVQSMYVTANTLLNNTAANVATNIMTCNNIVVTGNSTPANNTDVGTRVTGSIWADGTYLYYYNGTEIKRATLSTF